jgi:hypothetical protein
MAGETRDGRNGRGKFTRTHKTAQRDAEAAALRAKGRTFDEIAAALGFANRGAAFKAVQRAFAAIPYEQAEEARRLDLERIDRLIATAWDVMERPHLTVSQGKVVGKRTGWERDEATGEILRDRDGDPIGVYEDVLDDGLALAAIREIRGLLERRARMTGYDAPAKARVEIVDDEVALALAQAMEAEIAELAQEDPGDGLPGERPPGHGDAPQA